MLPRTCATFTDDFSPPNAASLRNCCVDDSPCEARNASIESTRSTGCAAKETGAGAAALDPAGGAATGPAPNAVEAANEAASIVPVTSVIADPLISPARIVPAPVMAP